jgi:hypothetical protein
LILKGEGKEKVKSKGPKSPRRQRRERSKGKTKRDFTGAEEGPRVSWASGLIIVIP